MFTRSGRGVTDSLLVQTHHLLEIPPGLAGDQLLEARDFIAKMVVSIMRKTFSDDGTGGHHIEYILRIANTAI